MNILDLSAEEFELALEEMGLEPEREQFLRDEFAKKNTVSGQMLGAFQEATAVPEGKERTNIAPMIKPEGMSGLEAIRSGEAELAVPGFLTGAVEEPLQALRTGEKAAQGLKVTEDELQQAAEVGASLGLSGAATRIGKPFDRTVISSGGASGSDKVRNPAFLEEPWRERPSVQNNSDLNFIASFYSPLKSAIEQMPIAKNGSTGQTISSYLNKRAPNVSSSELEYSGLKLDPNQRYTREDLSRFLRYSTDDVYANLSEMRPKKSTLKSSGLNLSQGMRFSKVQPQNVTDKQQAYFEITLDSDTLPKPLVPGATTHHGEGTLAHTRGSINTGPDGNYILVWELQSDPLQNIGKKYNPFENTGFGGPDTFRGLWLEEKLRDLVDYNDTEAAPNKQLFEDVIKKSFEPTTSREELKKFYEDKYNIQVSGKTPEDIHRDAIRKTTVSVDEPFEDFLDEFFTELDSSATDYRQAEASLEKGEIPFSTNTQYVKNLLTSLIARAKMDGISKIVIPSIQEIAKQRADDFEGGLDGAIKALRPTYVNAVKKAINILNAEGNGKINVGTRSLQYPDLTKEGSTRNSVATELDISDFNFNPETQRVRFAEGGMVEDKQMKNLMAEGGITDDGMDIEPTTGNEIPPGSLAKEVRDDIPAQLSEGEYVVPADVVRFFGVKFFEDLRSRAKQGLAEMDADGRIGGAPVDTSGIPLEETGDDLTPEEEQMLMEALGGTGMANGGMVTQTPANPYHSAGMLNQQPLRMAEGGMVRGASTFDRTQFTIPEATGAFEPRRYINPTTGEERTFQFLNGVALGSIPEGFVPWTAELSNQVDQAKQTTPVETPSVAPVQVTTGGGGNRDNSGTPTPSQTGSGEGSTGKNYDKWAEENYEALSKDPYQFGLDALSDTSGRAATTALGGLGLIAGGPLGAVAGLGAMGTRSVNKMQNIAEAKTALIEMEAQGLKNTKEYQNLDRLINRAVDDLPALQRLAVDMEVAATGLGYAESVNRIRGGTTTGTSGGTSSGTAPAPQPNLTFGTAVAPTTTPAKPAVTGGGSGDKPSLAFSDSTTGGKSATSTVTSSGMGTAKVSMPASATGGKAATPTSTKASDYSLGAKAPANTGKTVSTSAGTLSMGTPAKTTSTKKESVEQKAKRGGGFKDGGLVTKPTKAAPKKKGLAGK